MVQTCHYFNSNHLFATIWFQSDYKSLLLIMMTFLQVSLIHVELSLTFTGQQKKKLIENEICKCLILRSSYKS